MKKILKTIIENLKFYIDIYKMFFKFLNKFFKSIKEEILDIIRYIFFIKWQKEFYQACLNKNIGKIIYMMRDWRTDLTYNTHYVLQVATYHGYLPIVKYLLKQDVINPNITVGIVLWHAVQNERYEIVKLLLKDGRIDPSNYNRYYVNESMNHRYFDITKLLLDDHRTLDNYRDIFFIACKDGHYKIVKYFLDKNIHVELNSYYYVAKNNHIKVMELLLTKSGEGIAFNNNQALSIAAYNGHIEIVKLLLKDIRVDPSTKNNQILINLNNTSLADKKIIRLFLNNKKVKSKLNDKYLIKTLTDKRILPNYSPKNLI